METKEFEPIIGKTIIYTRAHFECKRIGTRYLRVQVPDASFRYKVTGINEEETGGGFIGIDVLIEDDTETTSLLFDPEELKALINGERVDLFTGGYIETVK